MRENAGRDDFWGAMLGLLEALRDAYQDTIEAPGRIGEAAGPTLIGSLHEADAREQAAAKWILWAMKKLLSAAEDEQAAAELAEALNNQDPGVRRAAARALGWVGAASVVPNLINALSDADSGARRDAAGALGRVGDASAVSPLLKALKDKHPSVRYASAWALGKIGSTFAVPALLEALHDEDRDVRRVAARGLGWIGDPKAIALLAEALKDSSSGVRRDAAGALGRVGDTTAIEPLLTALADRRDTVRYTAARALGQIGDSVAVPGLLQSLRDEDRDVRRAAAEALREIGDERAVPGLLEALRAAQIDGDEVEIYTLGVVLYEMLTSSLPAEAREVGAISPQIIDPITDVAIRVDDIINGVQKEGNRPASAGEMVRRIDEIIENESPPKPPGAVAPDAVTLPRSPTPAGVAQPMPACELVTESGLIIPLTQRQSVIGRGSPQDEVLPDVDLRALGVEHAPTVSRRHCRISWDGQYFLIEDLDSMNGTKLDEETLRPEEVHRLHSGDKISVGRVKLTFRITPPA
jgi:HEAT repeat protein